jgi:catechol 2,3-dioxygenase-like lactoylglutathione lyase family enzyme
MLTRRHFVALTCAAAVASPGILWATDQFPSMLDHIILGCNDLDRGIAFVEDHVGVRAVVGGRHPGRGTKNALLSLGERHYLEIMAPDPQATAVEPSAAEPLAALKMLTAPKLVTWAVHNSDINALAKKFRDEGIEIRGPYPGSRTRPDGRVLRWTSFSLVEDHHGLLPFFIEWSAGSVHPSSDAPGGCSIQRFGAADADPAALMRAFQRIGIETHVERSDKPQLHVEIASAKGVMELTS